MIFDNFWLKKFNFWGSLQFYKDIRSLSTFFIQIDSSLRIQFSNILKIANLLQVEDLNELIYYYQNDEKKKKKKKKLTDSDLTQYNLIRYYLKKLFHYDKILIKNKLIK